MKNIISVVIAICFLTTLQAQMPAFEKGKITFGDEIKMKSQVRQFVGSIGDNLYLESAPGGGQKLSKRFLHKIDKNTLKQTLQKEIEIEYEKKDLMLSNFAVFNGRLIAFASYYNKDLDKYFNFVQELNPESLKPKGDLIEIGEKDAIGLFAGKQITNVEQTLDGQYIIAYTQSVKAKKNAFGKISIAVLDSKLKPIWDETITMEVANKLMEVQDVDIDSDGTVYILIKERLKNGSDVKNRSVNVRYRLFKQKRGKDLKEVKVDTDDNLVAAANLLIYNNKLFVSGIYMDYKKRSEGLKGLFLAEISKDNGKVSQVITKEVGANFFTEGLSEKQQKKVEKKLDKGKSLGENYKLTDVVQLSDGSYLLTAEENWITEHTVTDQNGGVRTYYVYHRNNVLVSKLGANGEFQWVQNIRKEQAAKSPLTVSYVPCTDSKNLYLIFNSNNKNLIPEKTYDKGKIAEYNGNPSKSFAEIVAVDLQSGKYNRHMLFSSKDSKTAIVPGASSMVGGHCFIYSVRGKKKQFTTLTF